MTHGRAVAYLRLGDNGDVQLHPVSTSELVAAPFERADWTEKPILLHGPEPAEALIQLRTDAEASVLASLGVPPALVGIGPAEQADRRELMRSWQVSFVRPLLRLAAAELSRVLGASVSFEPGMMTPADLVSLTRAARSLIQSGIVAADVLRVVGLPADVELAPPTPAPTPVTT